MKKEKYEVPETDIISFSTEDVITTSIGNNDNENETEGSWE